MSYYSISKACRAISFSILILVSFNSLAQITFEKGYIIDNSNVKTECLIKNQDWDDNPTGFKYKLSENESVQTGNINTISEFGVYESFKYVKAEVKIDRSPVNLDELNLSKDPSWSLEKLFLKELLGGKATLYSYSGEKNIERYFYLIQGKSIQQLIYKQYYVSPDRIGSNTGFRQQLWIDVRCDKTQRETIETLNYNKKELLKHFKKYNSCFEDSSSNSTKISEIKQSRELLNLSLTPGINLASARLGTLYNGNIYDFKTKINFRIGFEAEFILPFNRNKWGIIVEPYFKNYKDVQLIENNDSLKIGYKAIELSFGLRHYFFLNKKTKLFVNVVVNSGLGLNFNSSIVYYDNYNHYYDSVYTSSSFNFGFGTGVVYNRISAELRYYTQQEILSKYIYQYCSYNSFSFILAYKFLKVKQKNK